MRQSALGSFAILCDSPPITCQWEKEFADLPSN